VSRRGQEHVLEMLALVLRSACIAEGADVRVLAEPAREGSRPAAVKTADEGELVTIIQG
jgi:hypothetical protein